MLYEFRKDDPHHESSCNDGAANLERTMDAQLAMGVLSSSDIYDNLIYLLVRTSNEKRVSCDICKRKYCWVCCGIS